MKFKLVEDFDRGLETQSSVNTLNESFPEEDIQVVEKVLNNYKKLYNPKGFVPLSKITQSIRSDGTSYAVRFKSMTARYIYDIIDCCLSNPVRINKDVVRVRL